MVALARRSKLPVSMSVIRSGRPGASRGRPGVPLGTGVRPPRDARDAPGRPRDAPGTPLRRPRDARARDALEAPGPLEAQKATWRPWRPWRPLGPYGRLPGPLRIGFGSEFRSFFAYRP